MKIHHSRVHGDPVCGVLECEWCGDEYTKPPSAADESRFCSAECRDDWYAEQRLAARPVLECENCGDEFSANESREETAKYCTRECKDDAHSDLMSGKGHPDWNGGDVTAACEICGEEFERNPAEVNRYDHNFCSRECMGEWRSRKLTGDNHPMWSRIKLECDYCGDTFHAKPHHADQRRFCSQECDGAWKSENLFGPDHPNWRHGKSLIDVVRRSIGDRSFRSISKEVRQSAGVKCEMCGYRSQNGGEDLDAHHIVPIYAGGTNGRYNLMSLCRSCHSKVEQYSYKLFDEHLFPDQSIA